MDITLCHAKGCPMKDTCKRAQEGDSDYFVEPPYRVVDGKAHCDMYWGKNQTSIMEFLTDITNGKHNKQGDKR